ncbi:MAG: yvoA [Chloroflexi bacterium]|nr:yvoA [Chloroflexota bacterium]
MSTTFDPAQLKIDTTSIIPLYHQIKQNIRDLIENEILHSGDLLPSERELSEFYGVNRLTVRQALNDLVSEGMLRRQRGVGTFVAESKLTQVLDHVLGFSERIREAGHLPSSRQLALDIIPAPVSVARRLGIFPDISVYKLVRLRCSDEEPVMFETAYLPLALFPGLASIDFSNTSLYQILSDRFNCLILEAEEQLEPVLLADYEAKMLEVDPGIPGMLVESTSYNQYGKIVEIGKSVVRGDKARFMFHIRRHVNDH